MKRKTGLFGALGAVFGVVATVATKAEELVEINTESLINLSKVGNVESEKFLNLAIYESKEELAKLREEVKDFEL